MSRDIDTTAAELLRLTARLRESEASLLDRQRHQDFLIDWGDRVRGETSIADIIDATLSGLGRHLGVTRATYSESEASGRVFDVLGEWRDPSVISIANTRFSLDDCGETIDREWMAGEVVCYHDIAADSRVEAQVAPAYLGAQIAAFVSIPLMENGRVRSALSVQNDRPRVWTESELQLLRQVAERTWVSLERARAAAALRDRGVHQQFLIDWADSVRDERDADAILTTTLARIGLHLGAARTNYCEAVGAGDLLVIQEWTDGAPPVTGAVFPLAAFGERVIADHRTGNPVQIDDIADDPRIDDTNRPLYDGVGVGAFLTIPLVRYGVLVALMSVQSTTARRWTDAEVELMRETADRTWAVLERARSERARAQSEAQLAAFMENAPVVMHIKDGDGRYIRINPEFCRAVGAPAEAILGRHPEELFPAELAAAIEVIEQRALAGQVASAELEVGGGDGYATVLSTVFPISGDGGAGKTAGVTIDLTERKRAEAALANSREALFQSEKISALGSLLAGVSHELNNPLSIVVAQAVMMERQAAGSDLAERAQKIRKAADRCARIVQTFLAMARQKRPERAPVDLNAVARAAQELADYGLKTDGIATAMDLAEGLPQISADSDQLHQIIINLIVNAQQAMADTPGGDRRLMLRTGLGEQPGTVMLEVADSGPGIPEDARRRIFEPFFTTKPQGHGTGVGLSFSQGLAEAHGGRLELTPSSQGACFRLTLPIRAQDEAAPAAPVEPQAEAPPSARRALVIDDEAEIAECLADFLSIEGFACEIAVGGEAAKTKLAAGRYDLVVSDLRMPGIDGPQLHAWLASARPDLLPRLGFATGDTLGASAARFLADAKRPVLEKPFMPDGVRRFLRQMELA